VEEAALLSVGRAEHDAGLLEHARVVRELPGRDVEPAG
jgi:hypothetical protein